MARISLREVVDEFFGGNLRDAEGGIAFEVSSSFSASGLDKVEGNN